MTNFQFPIWRSALNFSPRVKIVNQFSKKQLPKLAFVSVVCIVFGVGIGLVLNYRTIQELRSEPVEATPSVVEEEEKEKIATYSGTIKPSGKIYAEGTHYLEDEDGEVIVLLESSKIDLGLIEGWEVEVGGNVQKIEGGRMLMEVSEVQL